MKNDNDDLKSAFRAMKNANATAQNDADPSGELDLKNAFRAVKDEFDGTSPDADLTLHRALFASRLQTRRRKVVRWSLIPIAAALFASTAWAGATGRLAPVVETVREVFHAESAPAEPAPSPSLGYARAIPGTPDDAGTTELAQNEADAAATNANAVAPAPADTSNRAGAGATDADADANRAGAGAPDANANTTAGATPSSRAAATSLGTTSNAGATSLGANAGNRAGAGASSLGANAGNRAGAGATSLGANANAGNGAGASSLGATANAGSRAGAGASSATPSASAPARANAVVAANEPAPPPAAPPAARPVAEDPNAQLFADAHRIHFIERDPARALGAWDRYLASAPNGSLAPEARYNRALALIRLNRTSEARAELEKFANGNYSGYRRTEARALLDALARDAGP